MTRTPQQTAIVTGASRGLGLALAVGLAKEGWSLVIDARDAESLRQAAETIPANRLRIVAGNVVDPAHRAELIAAATDLGGLDLLVNNASILGPSPQPELADYPLDALRAVYEINAVAPLGLVQAALPLLLRSPNGRVVNVTSDAAVEPYEGWGGYGSSKAALDHLSAILAAEVATTGVRVWSVDPGDMRTQMHQEAFPGEDISDRPDPATVVPDLLDLINGPRPSGRVRVHEVSVS